MNTYHTIKNVSNTVLTIIRHIRHLEAFSTVSFVGVKLDPEFLWTGGESDGSLVRLARFISRHWVGQSCGNSKETSKDLWSGLFEPQEMKESPNEPIDASPPPISSHVYSQSPCWADAFNTRSQPRNTHSSFAWPNSPHTRPQWEGRSRVPRRGFCAWGEGWWSRCTRCWPGSCRGSWGIRYSRCILPTLLHSVCLATTNHTT